MSEPALFISMWAVLGGTLAFCLGYLILERLRG